MIEVGEQVQSDGASAAVRRRGQGLRPGQMVRDLYLLLAVLPRAVVRYLEDQCFQWAAALAYYTLIGLVPLLATLFAVMKVLGFHRELTPFIVTIIGAGSPDVADPIVRFIDQTNVATLGVISSIAVILAVVGILGNVELIFNVIWGRVPGRPWWGKIRAYAAVAFTGPTMLLIALTVTTLFRRGGTLRLVLEGSTLGDVMLLALGFVPYALLWFMFSIMYTVLPNLHVSLRSAIGGALVAGTLWQLAQWAYVTFMIGLVQYAAIYGALWQLPILLAWIYVGWLIVLFGAEVCAEHQRRRGVAGAAPAMAHRRATAAVRREEEWAGDERWEL